MKFMGGRWDNAIVQGDKHLKMLVFVSYTFVSYIFFDSVKFIILSFVNHLLFTWVSEAMGACLRRPPPPGGGSVLTVACQPRRISLENGNFWARRRKRGWGFCFCICEYVSKMTFSPLWKQWLCDEWSYARVMPRGSGPPSDIQTVTFNMWRQKKQRMPDVHCTAAGPLYSTAK